MKASPSDSALRPLHRILQLTACAVALLWLAPHDLLAGGSRATGATSDQLMVYNGAKMGTDIGDFISDENGLDEPYSYFIEVPPGLSRLVVEIFDPDILAVASATERLNDRDLLRPDRNTYARYRLFDPDGNQVPTAFGVGGNNVGGAVSTPNPTTWDNAWITFYDSDRAGATASNTFIDNFNTVAYNNNNGSNNFAGNWTEAGAGTDGLPTAPGNIHVTAGGQLSISNLGDPAPFTSQPRIHRQLDLSTFTNAVVSFDWGTGTGMEDNDAILFEVSPNGGTSWVGLDIFSNMLSEASSGSASYDITDYIATNTQVRFRIFDNFAGPGEAFTVDNFTISANTTADGPAPDAGHWRIEMDMSTEIKDRGFQQEELNAIAIRAHDGTSGAGGTEVNLYAHSYFSLGLNNNNRTRSYTMYPYITEGCSFSVNDFDHDSLAPDPGVPGISPPYGSWDLTSRSATFTDDEGGVLSRNDRWFSEDVSGWNADDAATDYGIWEMDMTISDFGSGNYAVYYIGNQDADDPDANADGTPGPTASPEADTVRIYFPTDANTAPSKPYATHAIRYLGPGGGPNPPEMGSVTTFVVTVRIVNPTGSIGSISFDNAASRTVTAEVPASTGDYAICYGGTTPGFPSSGTMIGEPSTTCPGGGAAGGTIEWEPADIATGAEAQLRYFITVEPLVATDPLTVPVSGTYPSDGTAVSFIDETGDTSGAFTLGPLCGLSIVAGPTAMMTPALLSTFTGRPAGNGTLLEWQTATEAGTAFFDVYRHLDDQRRHKINGKPLLAMLDAPQGGFYRFVDEGARPDMTHTYSVVETMASGRQIQHGPYTVQVDWTLPGLEVAGGYERSPHPVAPRVGSESAPSADLGLPRDLSAEADKSAAGNVLRITTGDAGIYRLTAAELAPHFGLSERQLRRIIYQGEIGLSHRGQTVAWRGAEDGAGIDFYAEANDTIYSGENVYWLRLGGGQEMSSLGGQLPAADWDPAVFRQTRRSEENERPLVLIDLDPESDIWFWDFMRHNDASHASKSFDIDLPAAADNASTADLTLFLQGASSGLHAADVSLNGSFVGSVSVQDLQAASATLPVSQGLLLAGVNTVQLTTTGGDLFFVDAFEMAYDRHYETQEDRLLSRGDGNDEIAVGGFTHPRIQVYDIANPLQPRYLEAVRRIAEGGGQYRVIWEPDTASTPYVAVSDAGLRQALSITVDQPSNLLDPSHGAEHLIIAPSSLVATAEALADHRRSQGLQSMVVDLQDIYDELNHGIVDLPTVRDFLAYTQQQWQQAPRYVVLAAAGTYDYRDYLGLGGNLISPFLRSDGETLFVTDTPFVDFDDDGLQEMAIGRLPVLTALELQAYIDKIATYEALGSPEWGSQVVLASDNTDIADFSEASDGYADLLSAAYQETSIHLGDFATLTEARQALFDALNDGAAVLSYLGHGGVDRLAAEGLMTSADVAALSNDGRPSVVVAVSCHIGFHGLPGLDSLGEELVLSPLGGAAAVWAPSWLSQHSEATFFGDRLFRQLFIEEELTLGDAVRAALENAAGLGVQKSLLQTYQLLGDPALEIRLVPDAIPGGPPCEPNCSGG